MATTAFASLRTPIVSSAAHSNTRNRRTPAAQSSNWWAPIFGWSAEPDFVNSGVNFEPDRAVTGKTERGSVRIGQERNVFRGCFTEEKARELRKKTIESSSFHDIMYHSAIAARLASDISGRRDR